MAWVSVENTDSCLACLIFTLWDFLQAVLWLRVFQRVTPLHSDYGIVIHIIPFQFFSFCLVCPMPRNVKPLLFSALHHPLSHSWSVPAGSNLFTRFYQHLRSHHVSFSDFSFSNIHLVIFQFNLVLPARCSLVYGLAGGGGRRMASSLFCYANGTFILSFMNTLFPYD